MSLKHNSVMLTIWTEVVLDVLEPFCLIRKRDGAVF